MISNITMTTISKLPFLWEELDTDTLLVVIDSQVLQAYDKQLSGLQASSKSILKKRIITYPISSAWPKSIDTFVATCDFFLAKNIHRNSHLVAIGGGGVSDLAGFVAATLLRGIPWSIVPSTLLAMVDAAIGGKVGIDFAGAKNQLGAYHMPKNVFLCHEFLASLPKEEMDSGMGEVIKYSFLEKSIYSTLGQDSLIDVIDKCAQFKQSVVNCDVRDEKGVRCILNFGHSFGHAIETIYGLSHGVSDNLGNRSRFEAICRRTFIKKSKICLSNARYSTINSRRSTLGRKLSHKGNFTPNE